jgi:hypothetical protein
VHLAQDEHSGLDARVSIEVEGDLYTGVRIGGKGVYTGAAGRSYRGQANDAKADGLGMLTHSNGYTRSGEWSAGREHGHSVVHYTNGAVEYCLHDRGTVVHYAYVRANGGAWFYDAQRCAADDARLLALTAAALDADVRPCHWPAAPEHRIPLAGYRGAQLRARAFAWGRWLARQARAQLIAAEAAAEVKVRCRSRTYRRTRARARTGDTATQ